MPQEPILSPGSVPRISYAPNHEDILLDRLFGDHVGTFMDVGACSPAVDSLTYFFYRRGWRGVNLEPIPRLHTQLQAARPGDLNLPLAAWDSNGEIPLYEAAGAGLSTFSSTIAEAHRARGVAIDERRVPVRTIHSLVEELGIDPPDFLVISVEGSAEQVIRGISLEHWRPGVLVVASTRTSHHGWEPLLLEHGYLFATFNGVNRFYLRADLRDQRTRLELPVSVLDRFQRSEVVALEQRLRDQGAEILRRDAELERVRAAELRERIERAEHHAKREERLALALQGCEFFQRQCAALRQELSSTQRALRPYRLIDQLGVVPIGYRWARRLKPNRAS